MSTVTSTSVDEAARLEAVARYLSIEFPPEALKALNQVAHLAAQMCGAPVALLGLVDADRYHIKANYRWGVAMLPRDGSFCTATVAQHKPLVVNDATQDPRFAHLPLVAADPNVRFYAGAPLVSHDDRVIGVLEVYDRQPRTIRLDQIDALQTFAAQAMTLLDAALQSTVHRRELADIEVTKQTLAETEERFRDLFDSADDIILSIKSDAKLLHANRAWVERLGYSTKDLARFSITDAIHPDRREEFEKVFNAVVQTGMRERIETVFLSNFGERMTVDGWLMPKVIDGNVSLIRVIFRDMTERHQAEIAIGRARDAALEAARLKSQFLANITHEIRTPMNIIIGMLDLLAGTELAADQRDLVQTAQGSAEELLTLVNNIIHVSKLESGTLSVALSDFDLVGNVERIGSVMSVMAQEKDLEFSVRCDQEIPAVLRGDVPRLRQVLTNIVQNAIKFTERGKIELVVERERETQTHLLLHFRVKDTGIGISNESMPHLFEPFFQADGSAARQYAGPGLGLATAKKLIELMGGVIGVESKPGEGSTFWFTIPFEKRTIDTISIAARKKAFTGLRILQLDHSDKNRKIVEHFMTTWGIRARAVDSCAKALDRLRGDALQGDPYHAIIFDMHMAEMDGLTFAYEIKSDPVIAKTGLIMMTSLGEQLDDEKVRASGVGAYLAKPIEQSELFDSLTTVLARDASHVAAAASEKPVMSPPAVVIPQAERSSLKILLAEDRPLNQKLTLSQLRSLGYDADVASNGEEVLASVARKPYDLILMDCQMPGVDGYQATAEIRAREGDARRTAIVALTANALQGDREKCLAAGMDDYLSKPTKQDELDGMLSRWLGRTT